MRAKPIQRAKIRLRLDRGTALLKHLKLEPISCELMDISEGGCQCRIQLGNVSEDSAESWMALLVPGRILALEVTEPGELKGFVAPEAEIRWVKTPKPNEMICGMLLRGLSPEQSQLLTQTLVSVATKKLGKKGTTPLPQPRPLVPPAPPPPPPPPDRPAPLPPRHAAPAAGSAPVGRINAPAPGPERPAPKREFHAPPASTAGSAGAQSRAGQLMEFERQKRFAAEFAVAINFCDSAGRKIEPTLHQGRVIDFNEGGFMIEAPPPDSCPAPRLQGTGQMLATVQLPNYELACKLEILSVKESGNIWRYGVRILDMPEEDRARLRELYIRESLTTITRRRR